MTENFFLGGKGGASFQNFIIHSIGVSSSSYQSVLIGANPGSFDGGRGALTLISLVRTLTFYGQAVFVPVTRYDLGTRLKFEIKKIL